MGYEAETAHVLAARIQFQPVTFPKMTFGGPEARKVPLRIVWNPHQCLDPLGRWAEKSRHGVRVRPQQVPDFLRVRELVEIGLEQPRMLDQPCGVAPLKRAR